MVIEVTPNCFANSSFNSLLYFFIESIFLCATLCAILGIILGIMVSDTPHYENEAPFEVPKSWEWIQIKDVCEVARGGSPRPIKDYLTNDPSGVNWIKIGDTTKNGKYIDSAKEKIKLEGVRKSRIVHKGDFLLTNSMSFGRPYILRIDGCIHDGWLVISPMSNSYQSDFLYYLLSSIFAYEQFSKVASGGVVTNLNSDKVADSFFPLPPYKEQIRIVEEIEKWFALIDTLESAKEDLQTSISQAKSKILDLAIHGKLVPQDPNDEPAIEFLKRINPKFTPCDNAHYENVPNSWCWTTLGEVCELITGSTPSKLHPEYYGGDFPFYKPTDLDVGRHVAIPSEFLTGEGKKVSRVIPVGATAICCIGSIGKCGYIEKEGATNQQINTAVPSKSLHPLYLYYFCNSTFFVEELTADSSAITISIVNKSKLSKMLIPIPPYKEQQRIVSKIEELLVVLDEIQKSIED